MNVGKCLKIENTIGCSVDVRPYLDKKCSGRKTCAVTVALMNREIQLECLQEMSPYLEASYKCLNGNNICFQLLKINMAVDIHDSDRLSGIMSHNIT